MAMRACWECKKEISSHASKCPACGAKQAAPSRPGSSIAVVFFVALVVAIGGYLVVRSKDPEYQAMIRDKEVYKLCMESLRQSMGNPIAKAACAEMRSDFWAKYHKSPD